MAKRSTEPPPPASEEIDGSLIALAEMLLSEYFFDPDKEEAYKRKLLDNRPSDSTGVLLDEATIEVLDADCVLRIEALRTWTRFRVTLSHPAFGATVQGSWSFEKEQLDQLVTDRTGDPRTIKTALELLIEAFEDGDLDDEEFTGFLEGLEQDDDETSLIGDDPTEPPEATSLDRNRIKAIAKRIARNKAGEISAEDRGWLEQTPQTLPVITEALVDVAKAAKRDEPLMRAYQIMLAMQLEFVRYRQDREWDWAADMLQAFQQRLIALAKERRISQDDWFMMCAALNEARVPVSDDVQTALADAGFKLDEDPAGPPDHMLRTLRGFMDELARLVSSPFDVIQSLQTSGAMLPAALRGFMATELALSPHQVLRDAVPLMLLDEDTTVRKAAAAALEQIARPDTLSPDALRRAIAVRNWLPAADRSALDAAIRKARLAGVEIGAWPEPIADLEFHASTIDGSGAQSILVASRTGKKGFLGGVLLRHGAGVVDTWADQDLSRGKINKLLRESQMSAPFTRVSKAFVDSLVQHSIGTSVEQAATPPAMLLEVAELLGGTEWRHRRFDVKLEAERLFDALDPDDRTPEGIEAGFARGLAWMAGDDVFSSWFEDGPLVQQTLAKLPRTDRVGMTALVMTDILPPKRAAWAERFLMMAMWHQAAAEGRLQAKARDLVVVAHALTGDGPLGEIPIMAVIAMQTVRASLLGAW